MLLPRPHGRGNIAFKGRAIRVGLAPTAIGPPTALQELRWHTPCPSEFWTSLRLDLLLTRCWGPVRMDDFRQTLAKLQVDENYRPGRTELTDLTEARHVDANFGNLWSVLNAVNNQIPGQPVRTRTVLIAPDDVMFGVGRMYQTLAQNSGGIEVENPPFRGRCP